MRPYQHSMSSAARCGGVWQDYLEVHEFIDSTKMCCADPRHRMILHSIDFGAALAEIAFPDRRDTRDIVRQHVVEDLGKPRSLGEWLGHCRRAKLPRLHPDALPIDVDVMVAQEVALFGESASKLAKRVCSLLMMPLAFAQNIGPEALCILGNSFGPALVRRLIGPPIELDGKVFDAALCAERVIFRLYRAIPPMTAVVQTLMSSHQMERMDYETWNSASKGCSPK
jgi:hypothetical protein